MQILLLDCFYKLKDTLSCLIWRYNVLIFADKRLKLCQLLIAELVPPELQKGPQDYLTDRCLTYTSLKMNVWAVVLFACLTATSWFKSYCRTFRVYVDTCTATLAED